MKTVLWTCLMLSAATMTAYGAGDVYDKLPVKEVTIFKDGHAYLLHEGTLKTDAKGNVLLDWLPNPVMGTFWAYSNDPKADLNSVLSSRDELETEQEAAGLEDLLKGNLGKDLVIKETTRNEPYGATLLRILEEKPVSPEPDPRNLYYPAVSPPLKEKTVLLKTTEGTRAVPLSQIQSVTFINPPSQTVTRKELKSTMTLNLDWKGPPPAEQAAVGMAYVQLGIRWIPNYRVEIDGRGRAVLKLQATLINELADLNDVMAHLVIGVPTFAYKDVCDPISFQESIARLSSHFRSDSSMNNLCSNAAMSQVQLLVNNQEWRSAPQDGQTAIDLGPELNGTEKTEDLFVFTLDHVTLKKGQRLVVPVTEFELAYEDVYSVNISYAPPLEMRRNFNSDQQLQMARLLSKPNAVHKIRLTNNSAYPLTTAPAAILKDGRLLAQGMMTYTAIGNKGDLEVTTAVNIGVQKSDEQTNITPNAVNWNGNSFSRVEMQGTIELTNFGDKPVKVQVRRSILGTMDQADSEGTVKQLGKGDDGFVFEEGLPTWWNWCSWPWWWYHFNGIGQAHWTLDLPPQEIRTVAYSWSYYWG